MNLCDAIKSGRPIRRMSSPRIVGSSGLGWVTPGYLVSNMGIVAADLTATDWEVRPPPSVPVTREQLVAAVQVASEKCGACLLDAYAAAIADELGLPRDS